MFSTCQIRQRTRVLTLARPIRLVGLLTHFGSIRPDQDRLALKRPDGMRYHLNGPLHNGQAMSYTCLFHSPHAVLIRALVIQQGRPSTLQKIKYIFISTKNPFHPSVLRGVLKYPQHTLKAIMTLSGPLTTLTENSVFR